MNKKLLSLLLMMCCVFSLFTSTSFAAPYTLSSDPDFDLTLGSDSFLSPFAGIYEQYGITGTYNEARSNYFHRGVDFKKKNDNNSSDYFRYVYPVADGTIIHTGYSSSAGNYMVIQHTSSNWTTYYTVYMHLDSYIKTSGSVTTSSLIAVSGNSGTNIPPHLHFELNQTITPSTLSRVAADPYKLFVNHYGVTTWTNDMTLVKEVQSSGSSVTMKAYGMYSGSRMAPSSNPTVYWRFLGNSTWNSASTTNTSTHVYSWSKPYNPSGTQIQFMIYSEGKWFDGINTYYTFGAPEYEHPAANLNSWTSSPSWTYTTY